jgi:hypothetical protein
MTMLSLRRCLSRLLYCALVVSFLSVWMGGGGDGRSGVSGVVGDEDASPAWPACGCGVKKRRRGRLFGLLHLLPTTAPRAPGATRSWQSLLLGVHSCVCMCG